MFKRAQKKQSRSGEFGQMLRRPSTLVLSTMIYCFAVLVYAPQKLTAQQVTQVSAVSLLLLGGAVFWLMYGRARSVSRQTDKDGFLEIGSAVLLLLLFVAAAGYVFIVNYDNMEVIWTSAALLALAIAVKLTPSRAKRVYIEHSVTEIGVDDLPVDDTNIDSDSSSFNDLFGGRPDMAPSYSGSQVS